MIAAAPARVGRDGRLRLEFERRGSKTVLARSAWAVPLQILVPVALDDPAVVVSILNPTGGVVGGDRLRVEVEVGAGAHACLTTPSATRIYRTAGGLAEQEVVARVGEDGALEWVPDHAIPFAGSAFRQRIRVDLAAGARLFLVDSFAAGRVARGEAWRFARFESALEVRDGAGWLLLDRICLEDPGATVAGLGVAEEHRYVATVVIAGPGADAGLAGALTAAVDGIQGARTGVAILRRGGLLVRCLARSAPDLLRTLEAAWAVSRAALLGVPPPALRRS